MMIPIILMTPMARLANIFPRNTPTKAKGMENMITNGPMKDSNWEAITIYTRMMMRKASSIMSENISCWFS